MKEKDESEIWDSGKYKEESTRKKNNMHDQNKTDPIRWNTH